MPTFAEHLIAKPNSSQQECNLGCSKELFPEMHILEKGSNDLSNKIQIVRITELTRELTGMGTPNKMDIKGAKSFCFISTRSR